MLSKEDKNSHPQLNARKIEYKISRVLNGHKESVSAIVQLKNNNLVSASADSTIIIWDIFTCKPIKKLLGHTDMIEALILLKDNRLCSGSRDLSIKIWDETNSSQSLSLLGHQNAIVSLCQLNSGQLASSSFDRTMRIWDIISLQCLFTTDEYCNDGLVNCILQLPDERVLFAGHYNITIWNINTHQVMTTIRKHFKYSIKCLILLNDGRIGACGGDSHIKIFDNVSFKYDQIQTGHKAMVKCIIQLTNYILVSGSCDDRIKIWNLNTKECIQVIKKHSAEITYLLLLKDNRFCSCSGDKKINIFEFK